MANFNFNKVILGGQLTADPELKTTSTGVAYINFSIAVNRRAKEGKQATDFINCIAWRKSAEFISMYFKKGSSICIVGSIQTRSWTDNQGNKRFATDILVDEACFVDSKDDNEVRSSSYVPAQPRKDEKKAEESVRAQLPTYPETPRFEDVTDDDDLPL